jgi:hypothetical protein
VAEVQMQASAYAEESVLALVSTMRLTQQPKRWDPKETRQAAVALLNRACGMPSQPLTGRSGEPLENEFPNLLAALKKLNGEPEDVPASDASDGE